MYSRNLEAACALNTSSPFLAGFPDSYKEAAACCAMGKGPLPESRI